MDVSIPIQRFHDLGSLSEAGYETTITASAAERDRIADWEGAVSVGLFEGRVSVRRLSSTRFSYQAELTADVVQTCVVTLEPVSARISRRFSRSLHYVPVHYGETGGAVSLASADDNAPEEIDSLKFDLAAPLLEEFSLAVEPYPRAPGVEFEPPKDEEAEPASPFTVLKALKQG